MFDRRGAEDATAADVLIAVLIIVVFAIATGTFLEQSAWQDIPRAVASLFR
jgi:hypothetical protein